MRVEVSLGQVGAVHREEDNEGSPGFALGQFLLIQVDTASRGHIKALKVQVVGA